MPVFKCKMCGGSLTINENESYTTCEYCGTPQTLPKLDNDERANLYDRANHFRRNNEYDKASDIYEKILNEDSTDSEAYWSLVLCRYGIEYVEDPSSHKRIPTVNRAQFTSIYADENYKQAIKNADGYQKQLYEEEARVIDEIQKKILSISQKESPFDVFICYKETDEQGRRTVDSVLANELYHELTEIGYKVFFSKITLEEKLGSAYEPYIFAALNSAKIMVVIGTKPEYFKSIWVKNEWSRYLGLIKSGAKKILIPAYKGMDPYDLPEEFSHLQALDMSKLGFIQDLIRGIKKIIEMDKPKENIDSYKKDKSDKNSLDLGNLLKRVKLFMIDRDWGNAKYYCEKILDIDAENPDVYLYKLLIDLNISDLSEIEECDVDFSENLNYKKVKLFSDSKTNNLLKEVLDKAKKKNLDRYNEKQKQQEKSMKISEFEIEINYLSNIIAKDKESRIINEQFIKKLHQSIEKLQNNINVGFGNLKKAKSGSYIHILGLILFIVSIVITALNGGTEEEMQKVMLPFMLSFIGGFTLMIIGFFRIVNYYPKEIDKSKVKTIFIITAVFYDVYGLIYTFRVLKMNQQQISSDINKEIIRKNQDLEKAYKDNEKCQINIEENLEKIRLLKNKIENIK